MKITVSNPLAFETDDIVSIEGHLWLFGSFADAPWKRRISKFLYRIHWPVKREYFRVAEIHAHGEITMTGIEPLSLVARLRQRIRNENRNAIR